jgi:hypothetical protein
MWDPFFSPATINYLILTPEIYRRPHTRSVSLPMKGMKHRNPNLVRQICRNQRPVLLSYGMDILQAHLRADGAS